MGWMYLASIVKIIAHVQCVGIEACHGILDGIIYVDCPNVMFLQFLPFGFCGKLGMFADARGVPRCICRKTPKIRKPKHLVTGATPSICTERVNKTFQPLLRGKRVVCCEIPRLCEAEKGKLVCHDISLYWSTLEICK